MRRYVAAALFALCLPSLAAAQEPVQTVTIDSGDSVLSARLLPGVGEGVRPAIVLFNGLPAGPNLPRAAFQLQTAGYTVLAPQYRGTGASSGALSLANSLEDGLAAVAWLRGPGSANVDPSQVAVFGVSYGGWVALQTAAADPRVSCVIALVPADFGVFGARWASEPEYRSLWKTNLEEIAAEPEAGRFGSGGTDGFLDDAILNGDAYRLRSRVAAFAGRPIFVAGGRQDPVAPYAEHYAPLVDALRTGGASFSALEFQGGHNPGEATAAAVSFVERSCFSEQP